MYRYLLAMGSVVLLSGTPALAQQQASIRGTVVDESGGALPGTTVTVTETSTGRSYFAVADDAGAYWLPTLPAGTYRVLAELSSFTPVSLEGIELRVGQNATLPIKMAVGSLQETLTVTSQAPLVDIVSSQVAGNVDRRQMEELPILGRNWMELAMHVKGMTANNIGNSPGTGRDDQFQLNLDGQQVTQKVSGSDRGQPKFSREAIAEFQIATNLFDVSEGRSMGIQVRAVTRAGTNNPSGALYANVRDDKFNAPDAVARRVLPYENQQVGGAIGGPIVRDRAHFFLTYELEREPRTTISQPPQLPNQQFTFPSKEIQHSVLGRIDHQISARDHTSYRFSWWKQDVPFELGNTAHPSQALTRDQRSAALMGTWSRVLNDAAVQEVRVGVNKFDWQILLAFPEIANTPQYVFPGLTIGGSRNYPQIFEEDQVSARYDLNVSKGKHDFKVGGEFIYWRDSGDRELVSRGEFIFNSRPADVERRFPADAYDNPAAWDLSGLDATVQRYDINVGDFTIDIPRPTWAIWMGDTWRVSDRLTVNLGLRWDVDWGILNPPGINSTRTFDPAGGVQQNLTPFDKVAIQAGDRVFKTGIRDLNNIAPRGGFNYRVTGAGDLVVRGGTGLYFSSPMSNLAYGQQSFNLERVLANSFRNDGQPGFIADPLRGVTPQDILSGAVPLPPQQPRVIAHDFETPYAWQSSIGFQKQIGSLMAVDSDLLYTRERNIDRARDLNMFFDPATGYNLDLSRFGRPDPNYGAFQWQDSSGKADYLALASGFNRRFQNRFQFNVTHTLMFFRRDNHQGTFSFTTLPNNSFNPDAEWSRASQFQRNTVRVSGIYHLPFGVRLSAAYFYGSGSYFGTTVAGIPFGKPGVNRLNGGAPITVRAEAMKYYEGPAVIGTLETVPRNALRGRPIHKVDLRVAKDIGLGGARRLSLIAEVFNLLNHANYGSYNGQVNSTTFGDPRVNGGNGYVSRSGQFGFRLAF
jgi:hypothetical protein